MEGVENPLYEYVKTLGSEFHHWAVDVGCGIGNLLSFLAENFDKVLGIDWSENMLKVAKYKATPYKNVYLLQMDMINLSILKTKFDIAFSINSISLPDDRIIEKVIKEIRKSLRVGGLFIAIFPSFDTVLYQRELTIRDLMKKGYSKEAAAQKANDYFVGRNKLNEELKTYADDGTHIQRFFDPKDIDSFLEKKAGFSILEYQKVIYPWELCREYGYGYFPGEPQIWDWFVVARNGR